MYWKIKRAMQSLLLHRLRSFLSVLGIIFGVVAVVTMLSIGEGAQQETLEQISQLGVNTIIVRQHALTEEQRKNASDRHAHGLSFEDVKALEKNLPMLSRASPLKVINETITGSLTLISPEILSVTPAFGEMKGLHLKEGRFLCDLDYKRKKAVCVIGDAVANALGPEGHVGGSLRLGRMHYEIVGILKSTHWKVSQQHLISTRNLDKALFIPLRFEKNFMHDSSKQSSDLTEIVLQMNDSKQMENALLLVKKILSKLHGGYEDYQIVIPQELMRQAYRTQRTFNIVLGGIAALSLLVGGIGIMNIMLATVSERTREIGIRRAVGASKRHILLQFMIETVLLTLVGAVIGVVLGMILSGMISWIAEWKTIVTPWSVVLSLLMASIVGIISGYYPAYRAAAMDPIAALRQE